MKRKGVIWENNFIAIWESKLFTKQRRNTYIVLSDIELNWRWTRQDYGEFQKQMRVKKNIFQLCEVFGRNQYEIALMMIDCGMNSLKRSRKFDDDEEYYIALENADIDWFWNYKDVEMFDWCYQSGMSLFDLCEKFDRTQEEIALMILDRVLKEKVSEVVS